MSCHAAVGEAASTGRATEVAQQYWSGMLRSEHFDDYFTRQDPYRPNSISGFSDKLVIGGLNPTGPSKDRVMHSTTPTSEARQALSITSRSRERVASAAGITSSIVPPLARIRTAVRTTPGQGCEIRSALAQPPENRVSR